jgi:dynein heavy chain
MQQELEEAASRLDFLMDYAFLSDDDVKLNSMTFRWPEKMGPIFELGETRIAGRRDEVERTLTKM